MKEKKVRYPKEGVFGEIDLSDGHKSYGRIVADLLISFLRDPL